MRPHEYALDLGWRPLLIDLGVQPAEVLRRAGLPEDLLAQPSRRLDSASFYRLWEAIDEALGDPTFPLQLGQVIRTESFSPPLFAALCSPDLATALERIARFKPLVAPMRLDLHEEEATFLLTLTWLDATLQPPLTLVLAELIFFVCLARIATRAPIRPVEVQLAALPRRCAPFEGFFGVRLRAGDTHSLRFSRADARRPFLTANDGMWAAFEPELRRRLDALDATATTAERVRAALLEGLPSGQGSADAVARKLALGKRTLQRRLGEEGTTFQRVLQDTREALARHYLQRTQLGAAEIAFLLGFEEVNSFYRAFQGWTGESPEGVRRGSGASGGRGEAPPEPPSVEA